MTNPELEQAIDADPDDDAKLLVYADWLQQQGDPRGELATVQHAIATATGDHAELVARERALLDKHVDHLLGPLDPLFRASETTYAHEHYRVRGLDPRWRCGFLDSIRITMWAEMDDAIAAMDDRYERWPILRTLLPDEDDTLDIQHLLRLVLQNPAARFLRKLQFGSTTDDYGPQYDLPESSLLDVLVEHEIPTLRSLELGALDFSHGETEVSWVALGNVGKVLRRFPQLREVALSGAGQTFDADRYKTTPNPMRLELGEIRMPELRAFAVHVTDLRRTQLESILYASWPRLERLDVWFGSTDRAGCECTLADAVKLIASLETTPTNLVQLGLGNAEFTDDLIEPLAESEVLRRLTTLDLSRGCLSDEGAALLRDHDVAFRHLDRLILDKSFLTGEGEAAVKGICREVSVADQRELYEDDARYVAVGE